MSIMQEVQITYKMLRSEDTENRECRLLESISDNYGKYVMTTDISFKNEMVLCMSI